MRELPRAGAARWVLPNYCTIHLIQRELHAHHARLLGPPKTCAVAQRCGSSKPVSQAHVRPALKEEATQVAKKPEETRAGGEPAEEVTLEAKTLEAKTLEAKTPNAKTLEAKTLEAKKPNAARLAGAKPAAKKPNVVRLEIARWLVVTVAAMVGSPHVCLVRRSMAQHSLGVNLHDTARFAHQTADR
jgi:hypothetical protein